MPHKHESLASNEKNGLAFPVIKKHRIPSLRRVVVLLIVLDLLYYDFFNFTLESLGEQSQQSPPTEKHQAAETTKPILPGSTLVRRTCRDRKYLEGYWNRTSSFLNLGEAGNYTTDRTYRVNERGFPFERTVQLPYHQPMAAEASKWDWIVSQPSECLLEPFDVSTFCETLANRSILLVGDSIMHLQSASLYKLLNASASIFHQTQWMPNRTKKTRWPTDEIRSYGICNNSANLTFARNDDMRLDNVTHAERTGVYLGWTNLLPTHQVLVLNSGTHSKSVEQYETAIKSASAYLKTHYHGSVYFRTTARGHLDCKIGSKPLNTSYENSPAYLDRSNSKMFMRHKQWKPFPKFNAIAKKYFEPLENATILDIADMTEQRPDGHEYPSLSAPDCLHYVLPSVIDHWNWLLFNGLRHNL
jgi:hypothetical protein